MKSFCSINDPSKLITSILLVTFITVYVNSLACDSVICDCQNSSCSSCLASEFYFSSSQTTCKLCPPQCRTCNQKQQCLSCRQMYYLSNTYCLNCPKYCKTCLSSQTCTQCITGYILLSNQCQKCQIPNVESCESLMTVKTCLSGYWKNGDSCSPCRQFCLFCTSSNNCLQCQDGYRIKVSAGTYCVACDTGCKTCSDTACSECAWNYRLVNGTCLSILSNCNLIANCQSCEYLNNTARCTLCTYPYFLSANGTCVQGSSLLCKFSNQRNPYNCLNQCSDYGYASTVLQSTKNIKQLICLPRLWIQGTMIQQVYFNSLYVSRYTNTFSPVMAGPYAVCGSQYIYSASYSNQQNTLKFSYTFQPYYKLSFSVKFLPIFKSQFPNTYGLSMSISMTDNATNLYTLQQTFNGSLLTSCQQQYLKISSRNIKDQQVSVEFNFFLINSTNYSTSQLQSTFPNGLVGLKELLIQVYRCDSKCRVCSNSKYCLECYGNYFLSSHICVDSCDGLFQFYLPNGDYLSYKSKYCVQQCYQGYYNTLHPLKNDTFICLKCPEKCSTCKSPTECLSCNVPFLLYSSNFSCLTSCPQTHYASVSSSECMPCNAPCRTCLNQTQCLSCSIGYFDGQNCVGTCPQGTYSSDSAKSCLNCDPKCSICQNTPTLCLTCKTPYKLLGTTCLQSCPTNTHYTYNNICLPCKSPCTLCTSQTQCLTCSRGYLFNNTCLTQCPTGYYKDVGNSRCNLCENNCLTCLSLSICKSCVTGTYLYNSMCLTQCPIKTYTNPSSVCIPCIPPCLTCYNETSCITCSLGYLSQLRPNQCLTQCEDGYYGYGANQTCLKCAAKCKTCKQEESFCITCYNGTLLENNDCVSSCSASYFAFNAEKCRPCSYPCKTCVQISSKCLTCHEPYILSGDFKCSLQCLSTQYKENGACFPCQSPCSSCTSHNNCTSCVRNSKNQTYLINTTCLTSCPSGMYPDQLSLKCKSCLFPCQTCSSARQCLSCVSGYLNVVKKTCEVCSSSYFPDEATKTCQLCSTALPNCLQCQSSMICKVCATGYFLMNSTCISQNDCENKQGYYLNALLKKCNECVPPCGNCLNSSYCESCVNGYLYQGKCPFTCPSGFYANQNLKQCLTCDLSVCKTCQKTPTQCTSCFSNSTLSVYFVQTKTCITATQCPSMYFIDNLYGYARCLKCIPPCKQCINASYCLSCTTGVLYQGSCSFSCPNKYFALNSNTNLSTSSLITCQQCSVSCLQCTQNVDKCISCPVTKFLQDNECVDKCDKGYYLSQYILECLKCQSPCKQCESGTYCKSCQDSAKILYYGQCIDQCPEGTYTNQSQCLSCPSQCQICQFSSLIICQKCSSGLYMNSTSYGRCQQSCSLSEYPDSQTRKCYPCQIPCQQCSTATKCITCIDGYLIYSNDCLKGAECLQGTYLDPFEKKCLDRCYEPYYGDNLTRKCVKECSNQMLKVPIDGNRVCAAQCPKGYYVDKDYLCAECKDNLCNDLLGYEIFVKSIFNRLFIKVKFSKQVLTDLLNQTNLKVFVTQLSPELSSSRRLQQITSEPQQYNFTITQRTARALWLSLQTSKTLRKASIKLHFSSYYLLSPISSQPEIATNIQTLNSSVLLKRFDQYTSEQIQSGKPFQTYAAFLSFALLAIVIISMIGNFLSLFYSLIDYFQILFLLSFLQIDYTPSLNYFLYGFRYSHYLFLPQIFRPAKPQEYSQTPGKFGIIVPDADFLSNTGHDFLIIFVALGVIIIVKVIDMLLSGCVKNNKVRNFQENKSANNSSKHSNKSKQSQVDHQISINNEIIHKEHKQDPSQLKSQVAEEEKKTHNIIEQQILQGKHGRVVQYTKIFISRLKWNYFNDISYCLYFYLAVFSYSQTYIFTQAKTISNLFAVIGFLFTLMLPLFYIYLIRTNRSLIQSTITQHKTHLPFKTFYYFTIPDSSYTLYHIPIKYLRKLFIAILLVYCSQFPEFVLGLIMMFTLLNMIMTMLYKPYLLIFEMYVQLIVQMFFVVVVLCLCVMELQYLDIGTQGKLVMSRVIVAVTIIMTLVLIVWNAIRFVVQIIKEFTQKDYFEGYYREIDEISEKMSLTIKKRQSQLSELNASQPYSPNNDAHQQSNVRLNENFLSPKNHEQVSSFGHRMSQDEYSGLDIYLKKQHDAPPMLIKCIKNFDEQDDGSSQSSQNDNKEQDQQSDNSQVKKQPKKSDSSDSNDSRQQESNEDGQRTKQQGQSYKDDNQNQFISIVTKPPSVHLHHQKPKKNSFAKDQVIENSHSSAQSQEHSNGNDEHESSDKYMKQPVQRDVKEIFVRNSDRGGEKMKTIMEVEDFDASESGRNDQMSQSQEENEYHAQQQLKMPHHVKHHRRSTPINTQRTKKQEGRREQKKKTSTSNKDLKITSFEISENQSNLPE